MLDAQREIYQAIRQSMLPQDWSSLFTYLMSEDKTTFTIQEGLFWDYKVEFPFSQSDDYFGGVVRLVCALANTYGGLVIFGVDDKSRLPGKNKVRVDIERFNRRLREVSSYPIECIHRRYHSPTGASADASDTNVNDCVDIILVPQRIVGTPPVRLTSSIGRYRAGTIWHRLGAEVLTASSKDISFLYGSRRFEDEDGSRSTRIDALLPPSPSTLHEFVGRTAVLDSLYMWLLDHEEPRAFLWGIGGSGKSTLAYEFATILSDQGKDILCKDQKPIDWIGFFSAKERQVISVTGQIGNVAQDFSSSRELFELILELTDWMSRDDISKLDDAEIRRELRQLFDTQRLLIVMDDIDTLTTKGIDAGMEILFQIASRSKMGAKLLYTQRSMPTSSISNGIEVPGLRDDGPESEYRQFVRAYCRQLNLDPPGEAFVSDGLARASERRPLIVEVILGLKRTAGSYDTALKLFETSAGENARQYLFQREYMALPPDNRARILLAALALLREKRARFADLLGILQWNEQMLRDAIAAVREMFLQSDTSKGQEIEYTLGPLARDYIIGVSPNLSQFANLRSRVQSWQRSFQPIPARLRDLLTKAEHAVRRNDPRLAWTAIEEGNRFPDVFENPIYQARRARVAAELGNTQEARDALAKCMSLKHVDIDLMRDLIAFEYRSGHGTQRAQEICRYVMTTKGFSNEQRAEFAQRLGGFLYFSGRQLVLVREEQGITDLEASISMHFSAATAAYLDNFRLHAKTEEYCRSVCWLYFHSLVNRQEVERGIKFVPNLKSELVEYSARPMLIDWIVEPLLADVNETFIGADAPRKARITALLKRLATSAEDERRFLFRDKEQRARFLTAIRSA